MSHHEGMLVFSLLSNCFQMYLSVHKNLKYSKRQILPQLSSLKMKRALPPTFPLQKFKNLLNSFIQVKLLKNVFGVF